MEKYQTLLDVYSLKYNLYSVIIIVAEIYLHKYKLPSRLGL